MGNMRKIQAGFSLIEILLAVTIIVFILIKGLNFYSNNPFISKEAKSIIAESGIDMTSYKAIIDSSRAKIEDIHNKRFEALNKLEEER
jgi:prepilin-type N-terminal cleavage/methylation domain-containing protein